VRDLNSVSCRVLGHSRWTRPTMAVIPTDAGQA